jgi:site-specific DNA-methyltransferase (adenine-specific)
MLLKGNCLELLAEMPDNSVDSIVTDPPYELGFMGKSWDNSGIAYNVELWSQALRVLKPGGHLLAFGGSRTYHRLASAVEDAGFEIRDQIMWLYGSGFPKSLNLKDEWQGWGTALKPAHEPIVVARKPLIGTVATNVLTYGTGAMNIDGSRVVTDETLSIGSNNRQNAAVNFGMKDNKETQRQNAAGRWPANVIHDGSEEVLEGFPTSKDGFTGKRSNRKNSGNVGNFALEAQDTFGSYGGQGSASRFFYCAKASKSERNAGLEGLPERLQMNAEFRPNHLEKALEGDSGKPHGRYTPTQNFHPTVKPIALMRYLVKLVTPPNGTVLDPFLGSGTTAVAAILESFNWMGCEMTEDYWPIIEARVAWAALQPKTLL